MRTSARKHTHSITICLRAISIAQDDLFVCMEIYDSQSAPMTSVRGLEYARGPMEAEENNARLPDGHGGPDQEKNISNRNAIESPWDALSSPGCIAIGHVEGSEDPLSLYDTDARKMAANSDVMDTMGSARAASSEGRYGGESVGGIGQQGSSKKHDRVMPEATLEETSLDALCTSTRSTATDCAQAERTTRREPTTGIAHARTIVNRYARTGTSGPHFL